MADGALASVTFRDFDNESSSTSFWLGNINALNFDAYLTALDAVAAAIAGVSRGVENARSFTQTYTVGWDKADNPEAQRETKWLVQYRDTTEFLDELGTIANVGYGRVYTMEIPCANLSLLREGTDELNTGPGTPGEALVNALEANVRAFPSSGAANPSIQVIKIRHVSRNT